MQNNDIEVYFDDGIVIIDYGAHLITEDTMAYVIKQHEKLTGIVKNKILIYGQGGLDVSGKLREISCSDRVANLCSAVALIPTTKSGFILASVFMKVMTNPYPTKVFTHTEEAKKWLQSLPN